MPWPPGAASSRAWEVLLAGGDRCDLGRATAQLSRILITGAAGRIGNYLRAGLPALGWTLRCYDIVALDDVEDAITADIRDPAALAAAMVEVDAVVHLAGIPTEAPFADILSSNIEGTHQVFEAARQAGVRRMVFPSSNHAVGFTPRVDSLGVATEPRPDSYYGVSKLFGEVLGRLYVDRNGMEVACLRIGSCCDRPTTPRHLATWLSPGDAALLVHACLTAPDLRYAVMYGISANSRAWWDLGQARALGYEPRDDAEVFAREILAAHGEADPDDPDLACVGGRFARRFA